MTRTDVHRPSAITAADYEFVAIECMKIEGIGDCEIIKQERARFQAHKAQTGGDYSRHEHGGNCGVCGNAFAIYTLLFYHRPSNTYVRVGRDCAEKLDFHEESRFRRVTDAVTAARESRAGKLKAQGVLAELELSAAWDIFTNDAAGQEESTIRDIVGKLVKYGSISEAQQKFIRTLLDRIPQRAERAEQRRLERESAKPAPVGRARGEFDVLSIERRETDFGPRFVMTIKHVSEGWLAWGTAPADVNKGDRITLAATFEPSDRDEKFSFFKRPKLIVNKEAA